MSAIFSGSPHGILAVLCSRSSVCSVFSCRFFLSGVHQAFSGCFLPLPVHFRQSLRFRFLQALRRSLSGFFGNAKKLQELFIAVSFPADGNFGKLRCGQRRILEGISPLHCIIARAVQPQIKNTVHTDTAAAARILKQDALGIHKQAVIQLQEKEVVFIGLGLVIVKSKTVTDIHSLERLCLLELRV